MWRTRAIVGLLCLTARLGALAQSAEEMTGVMGEARSADGVTIRYEVRGSGQPALVLVHGWTNTRGIWGVHPRTLAQRYRTVALDLGGHGESGNDRTAWTMDAFGQDIAAVVRQLDLDQVVLVGFSMGGSAVLEAVDHLRGRVLGVVLIDAVHDPDVLPPLEIAQQIESQMRANWRDTSFLRAFAFTPDAPDSLVVAVAAMMPEQPREHWFTILRQSFAWIHEDARDTWSALGVPVAAINTMRYPTNVEAFRRLSSSFTLDTLSGVGHAGILLQRVEDFDARLIATVERFARARHER